MYSAPFHISARRIKDEESPPAFYVHSKGDKAGLPSDTPIPSGYVVYLDETQLLPQYFKYLLMHLNQSGAFKRYEKGAVIPFVRVEDMTDVIYDFFRKQAQSRQVKEAKHNLEAERNAAKLPDSKFNAKELKKGTDREMEHTKSRVEAEKIAKQHLFDNPKYYSKLDKTGLEEVDEEWSEKYKRSIDCNNPKGFSQRAHCQGKKKMSETLYEGNCGCSECETCSAQEQYVEDMPEFEIEMAPMSTDGEQFMLDPEMADQINTIKGNPDLNGDEVYSPEELYYHFDLDNDGQVTPDEYEQHVNWHAGHPEIFDQKVQSKPHRPRIAMNEKKDRCYRLAKQKYDVFPSAYASGFIVRCRKGKVGKKKLKEYIENMIEEELSFFLTEINEGTFDKEKSQGLHGWFARKGGKGKSKGWVDCNTCRTNPKTGRKTCKTCGRQDGEQRSKYPACRPTPSACNKTGTSRKKSSQRVSWKKD